MQNIVDLLLGHAAAIVRHRDTNIAVHLVHRQLDFSIIVFAFHAVIHGIFNNRLNGDFGAQIVEQRRINVRGKFKFVFEPDVLNGEIAYRVLDFFSQRNNVFSLTQRDTEKLRQQRYHFSSTFIFSALNHPNDGIQCVVQKMRRNLRLQQLALHVALFLFVCNYLMHQSLNALCHAVEVVCQRAQLTNAFRLCPHAQISDAEPFHHCGQFADRMRNQSQQQQIRQNQHGARRAQNHP